MSVNRERKIDPERQAAEEEVVQMEVEWRTATMKANRQAADVELTFQFSDWLQIAFRFVSDW